MSDKPAEIPPLILEFGNAAHECGAWSDGEEPPYEKCFTRYETARLALIAAFDTLRAANAELENKFNAAADLSVTRLGTINGLQKANAELEARAELEEMNHLFDANWKADMRAVAIWREGHAERELVLPDRTDLVVFLLADLTACQAELEELRKVMVRIWNGTDDHLVEQLVQETLGVDFIKASLPNEPTKDMK